MARGELKLFSNRSGDVFADKLVKELNKLDHNIKKSKIITVDFADGESKQVIGETVRGSDVYLLQNCLDKDSGRSINDNFIEMCQAAYALKGAGASKVTIIMPYHPYLRQDKTSGREPITARLIINCIEALGFDNVISSELHADQIEGFYNKVKIDNLRASNVLIEYLKNNFKDDPKNTVIISPDAGGAPRAEFYAKKLGCRVAQAFKVRSKERVNYIDKLKIAGKVKDRSIIVVDDMIDTAGSIEKVIKELIRKGAKKDITVCCTHAILSGPALERISELGVKVIGTDTIPHSKEFLEKYKWFKEVSLAPLFAKAIYNINNDKSVSELLK